MAMIKKYKLLNEIKKQIEKIRADEKKSIATVMLEEKALVELESRIARGDFDY